MASTRAIVIVAKGEAKVLDVPVPRLRDDYITVKVKAVALNPTDWKHVDNLPITGARVGCDYAGVVEEIGSKVTKAFKKGDRVAGIVHGANQLEVEDGSFGEYITAKGDIQIQIPDHLSFEEASTLGVGITTVGQTLYQSLKLPLPGQQPPQNITVLIYGGSTATGTLAIQYAKLTGATVITTCSPHSFELVKSLGADAVFDYKSPTCVADIRAFTQDKLAHVLDCIAKGPSIAICAAAFGPAGGAYSGLLNLNADEVTAINPKVTVTTTVAYTVFGEALRFGRDIPPKPEDWEFGKAFWELARRLLEEGKIKVHPPAVNKFGAGFEGILKGLSALRQGEVSGEKLVFTL